MFDAKSLLDALVRGAQPQQPAQQPAQSQGMGGLGDLLGQLAGGQQSGGGQPSGGGGLADILGKMMQGGGQSAAPQAAPGGQSGSGGMGGLGDVLGQLQKQMGGQGQSPQMAPGGGAAGNEGGGGGLGDILGELQKQLQPGGQGGTGQGAGGQSGGGGLMDILGQVLGQATSGVKEGASRIDEATGVGRHARDAVGQATGRSPEELLQQLQDLIKNNQLGAGAAMGGLGALVLGTKTGRSLAVGAAKIGALALIGGLAYKAYQNYSQGRSPMDPGGSQGLIDSPAPQGSGFEPDAVSNEQAILYIRAMIAAAAADGRIDEAEQQKILGGLQQAGLEHEAREFLQHEIDHPATADDLAAAVSSPEEAVQVFTAARVAVDLDNAAEHEFLVTLASRLGIEPDLARHIDAAARTAA